MKNPRPTHLTPRFEEALVYAARLHRRQRRKSSGVPYLSHLLGVAALVLGDGGSEDEAIAALLHDAVEDQGGMETLEDIRARFGEQVAEIVLACSDAVTTPKPPWRQRKQRHLQALRQALPGVRRVVLADKLHNARAIRRDLRREGRAVWKRFNGGKSGTLWYYGALLEALRTPDPGGLFEELERVFRQIARLAG